MQQQQQMMFQRLQDQINRMEERDQELRLREEKLRTEEAVAKQKQKLLDEKEKLYNILHAEKKEPETGTDQQNSGEDINVSNKGYNNHNSQTYEEKELFGRRPEDTRRTYEHGGLPPTIFKPLDLEGNGYIKNNDFRDALMSLPQPPSDEVAEQLIKSMDKEDTGQVNYEEFVQYYVSEMDEEEKQMAMQQGGEYSDYTTSGNNADNYALDGYDTVHVHIAKTTTSLASHCAAAYGAY